MSRIEKEKSLERIVSELHPLSLSWMEKRGYVEWVDEDGYPVIRITDKGYSFFNSVGVQK